MNWVPISPERRIYVTNGSLLIIPTSPIKPKKFNRLQIVGADLAGATITAATTLVFSR